MYVRTSWGLQMKIYTLQLYMPKTVVQNLSRRIVILLIMGGLPIQKSMYASRTVLTSFWSKVFFSFSFLEIFSPLREFTTKIQTSTFLLPFFWFLWSHDRTFLNAIRPIPFNHVLESVFYPFWNVRLFIIKKYHPPPMHVKYFL